MTGSSVARFRSLRGSACHSLAFASLLVGAVVDFEMDEVEEVGEVAGGPVRDRTGDSFWKSHVRNVIF